MEKPSGAVSGEIDGFVFMLHENREIGIELVSATSFAPSTFKPSHNPPQLSDLR
jgi:hypothetical protein